MRSARIICADVLGALPTLEAESFDACLTDPPYALTANKRGGTGEASLNLDSPAGRSRVTTGGGFMGKEWDQAVPGPEVWVEVLRVLKPGAMLLAFGGTRTHHRLMVAIEDAGFEIRDCLMWLYGSGFPKSLAIDKAIDRIRADDVCHVCEWLARQRDSAGKTNAQIDAACGLNSGGASASHWTAGPEYKQPRIPPADYWPGIKKFLGLSDEMDAEVWRLNGRKGKPGDDWYHREVVGVQSNAMSNWSMDGETRFADRDITAPATPAARTWQGHGTALKPAYEPIILAMKPLDGTFAENALKHGVAGINVDGARIGTEGGMTRHTRCEGDTKNWVANRATGETTEHGGRFPSNLLLDEDAARALDEQAGWKSSGLMRGGTRRAAQDEPGSVCYGTYGGNATSTDTPADSGGPSRFFYTSKASSAERGEGNLHPTVKPLDLTGYLAKLILPPERERPRRLLVPFCGSGSEIIGALRAGWDEAVGIELNPEYAQMAERRIVGDAPLFNRVEVAS